MSGGRNLKLECGSLGTKNKKGEPGKANANTLPPLWAHTALQYPLGPPPSELSLPAAVPTLWQSPCSRHPHRALETGWPTQISSERPRGQGVREPTESLYLKWEPTGCKQTLWKFKNSQTVNSYFKTWTCIWKFRSWREFWFRKLYSQNWKWDWISESLRLLLPRSEFFFSRRADVGTRRDV